MPPNCLGIYSLAMHPTGISRRNQAKSLGVGDPGHVEALGVPGEDSPSPAFPEHLESDSVLAGRDSGDTRHEPAGSGGETDTHQWTKA